MKYINGKYIFLILILLISVLSDSIESTDIQVLAVFELVRHGARAPLIKFNKVKNLYFGSKKSQLTINGCRQHLLLGRWVRRRYVDGDVSPLLNKKIDPSEITVICSPLQRTIFSASSHILGLFPKAVIKLKNLGHNEIRTDDIPPIYNFIDDNKYGKEVTITVINDNYDNMFRVALCRRKHSNRPIRDEYERIKIFDLGKLERKQAIHDILMHYGDYFKTFKITKKKFYSEETINKMNKFLQPLKYHTDTKLNLKKSTKTTMKRAQMNKIYSFRIKDTIQKKLLASKILKSISNFFMDILTGKKREKFMLLSGHGNNIIDVLSNLLDSNYILGKIYKSLDSKEERNFLIPPLASSLIFELIQIKNEEKAYIRILYNGQVINKGFSINIRLHKNNHHLLLFEDFNRLILSRVDYRYEKLVCVKEKHKKHHENI